jgi:DeoR family fructose operon transcriptional repressor
MLTLERQEQIMNILREKKTVTVRELSETLFASGSTIRRDLAELENAGLLRRSHGGAVLFEASSDEASARVREQQNRREKKIIGELGASLLTAGSSLFLDSSSTAGAMIPYLDGISDLTVITNGLRNALLLAENPELRVVIACGTVRPNSGSLYGADTLSYLSGLHPRFCFLSCGGLSASGITESTFEQGTLKRQMLHGSETRVLLCDSSKFGKNCLYRIGALSEIDVLVCNERPPEELAAALEQNGVQILPG